jgi:hypothetical protein
LGVPRPHGAQNTKIGFLKVRRRRTFKKPIFIIRIADIFLAMIIAILFYQFAKVLQYLHELA